MERTTVRLPEALLARARRKAAAEGRTLTSLIEEGLLAVTSGPRSTRQPRVLPPVSTAQGPPRADLDPARLATQVEEEEDMERVARMWRER